MNKKSILIITVLVILVLLTGYYAFKLKTEYENTMLNIYNESFGNLVNYVNSVETYLAKSMITKSSSHASKTLTEVWRDANLAIVYLSKIPIESETISNTAKYLNQISDYSYTLSKKCFEGNNLNDDDLKNLESLYSYSVDLKNTLNQISEEIYSGEVSWSSLNKNNIFNKSDEVNVFSNIDDNLNEYEGLIYDGAYSDHVNKVQKLGLGKEEITEEQAKEIVYNYFGKENVEIVNSNGFIENADIPCYDFSVKILNKEEYINIDISKQGGNVIEVETNREVLEEKISIEEANSYGKEYLKSKGFDSMSETYYMNVGNILTINYAYEDKNYICNNSGVIIYPDLIKVKVALDNGEILGVEAAGYLNSHTTRNYENVNISLEEAKKNLNENLEIISSKMAIIPTEWKTEILCYEFKGKVENKEFLVYINASTGKEEDVLVILNTPGGILTN